MAIRAVIFDFGMVLSHPQEPSALHTLQTITGLDAETFDSHYWTHRLAYDQNTLNGIAYWRQFAADAGISLSPADIPTLIENDVLMWSTINETMLQWANALANAGLRIGILSNMGADMLRFMRQEFVWLDSFHHLTWSCELGIVKPDPAIYIHTCEKLGVAPSEALFLDDKLVNIEGAQHVGLHAIQFSNVEQLRNSLRQSGLLAGYPLPGDV